MDSDMVHITDPNATRDTQFRRTTSCLCVITTHSQTVEACGEKSAGSGVRSE